MEKEVETAYQSALIVYVNARKELAEATVEYDKARHTVRKELYDAKEAGQRKMTEEQIRSESVVKCQAVYERYTTALATFDIARERLEFVKAIANN